MAAGIKSNEFDELEVSDLRRIIRDEIGTPEQAGGPRKTKGAERFLQRQQERRPEKEKMAVATREETRRRFERPIRIIATEKEKEKERKAGLAERNLLVRQTLLARGRRAVVGAGARVAARAGAIGLPVSPVAARVAGGLFGVTGAAAAAPLTLGVAAGGLAAGVAALAVGAVMGRIFARISQVEAAAEVLRKQDPLAIASFKDVIDASVQGGIPEAYKNLGLIAVHGKNRAIGGLASSFTFIKELIKGNDLSRSASEAHQEFWKNQLDPHPVVRLAQATMKLRWGRQVEAGSEFYGGWKEAPIAGG